MVNKNTLRGKGEIPKLEDTLGCGCKGECSPCACEIKIKDKASTCVKPDMFSVYDKARLALGVADAYPTKIPSGLSVADKVRLAIGVYE